MSLDLKKTLLKKTHNFENKLIPIYTINYTMKYIKRKFNV